MRKRIPFIEDYKKESERLSSILEAVFRSMADGVIVYGLDEKIIMINHAAVCLHERESHESCLGLSYKEFMQPYKLYNEKHQLLNFEEYPAFHLSRDEKAPPPFPDQVILELPSGKRVYVEVQGTLLFNAEGQVTGRISVIRDITKRYQDEEAMQRHLNILLGIVEELIAISESEGKADQTALFQPTFLASGGKRLANRIRNILQSKYVSIIMINEPDKRLQVVGVSGLTEKQEEGLRDYLEHSTIHDIFSATDLAELHANHAMIRDLKKSPAFIPFSLPEERYRLISPMMFGQQLLGVFTITHIVQEKIEEREEITLAIAIARLVTLFMEYMRVIKGWAEAHANEITLQETSRNFEVLLSVVSHELKTPLTTIQGNIQLALRRLEKMKPSLTEKTIQDLDRIQRPLEYASQRTIMQDQLILDLLDTTRIRESILKYVMKSCDLTHITENAVKDVQMNNPNRTIISNLPNEAVLIRADENRITQVINNYLNNALKYSPADKKVGIRLSNTGEEARIEVSDGGQGIPPEEQTHIWERFYRIKNTEVQYGSNLSLGVGLYLCRTIIEYHNGQFGVDSTSGHGSTFWFTLPLITKDQPTN